MNCVGACIVVALSALSVGAPAAAQGATASVPGSQAASGDNLNPNQIICEKQEITGSRLGTKRVCKTRAQWADLKMQDRQEIERVQVQRGMKGN